MSLLDRLRDNLQESATLARDELERLAIRRELGRELRRLGGEVADLAGRGELAHPALEERLAAIRELREELAVVGEARGEALPPARPAGAEHEIVDGEATEID